MLTTFSIFPQYNKCSTLILNFGPEGRGQGKRGLKIMSRKNSVPSYAATLKNQLKTIFSPKRVENHFHRWNCVTQIRTFRTQFQGCVVAAGQISCYRAPWATDHFTHHHNPTIFPRGSREKETLLKVKQIICSYDKISIVYHKDLARMEVFCDNGHHQCFELMHLAKSLKLE